MKNKRRLELNKQPTLHHRKPRHLGGGNDARNVAVIRRSHHEAWHTLFEDFTVEKIVALLNEKYIDPDYEICWRKK